MFFKSNYRCLYDISEHSSSKSLSLRQQLLCFCGPGLKPDFWFICKHPQALTYEPHCVYIPQTCSAVSKNKPFFFKMSAVLHVELLSFGSHTHTRTVSPWGKLYWLKDIKCSVSSGRSRESGLHQLTLSWSHLPIRIRHLSRHSYKSAI